MYRFDEENGAQVVFHGLQIKFSLCQEYDRISLSPPKEIKQHVACPYFA